MEIQTAVQKDGENAAKTHNTDFVYKAPEGVKLLSFDLALADFVSSTTKSMDSALMATNLAIVHYFNTGDLSYCQRFLDAIPKNYVRRTAYLSWLHAFAPILLQKDRLYKDKSTEAATRFGSDENHPMSEDFLLQALAKSFWDFKPEPEIISMGEDDIIGNLLKGVNTLRGKRYDLTDEAIVKLGAAEKALVALQ